MGLADSVYMCRRDSSSSEVQRIFTRKCLTGTDVARLPSFRDLHSPDIVQVKGGRNGVRKNKTNKVPNHLLLYRSRMQFTKEYVARLLGHKSARTVARLEGGHNLPGVSTLFKLSAILRVPTEFLYQICIRSFAAIFVNVRSRCLSASRACFRFCCGDNPRTLRHPGSFIPTNVDEYFALQLAKRFDDVENARPICRLFSALQPGTTSQCLSRGSWVVHGAKPLPVFIHYLLNLNHD